MNDRLLGAIPRVVVICVGIFTMLLVPEVKGATEQSTLTDNSLPRPYVTVKDVEGRFTIAGSNTMYPLMVRLAADFKRHYPNVQIGVQGEGSKSVSLDADSITKQFWEMVQNKAVYRRGDGSDDGHHVSMQVQMLASSRKLSAKEFETFQSRYGYTPMEIPIALEAVAVYVHRDNPLLGLTLDQVDAIFSETHRRNGSDITTWGQLDLNDGWRDAPLHLYGRDQRSGTRAFFKDHVLLNGEYRSTVKEVAGSANMILAVGRDPLGIGYGGIEYQTSTVRALPLAPKTGVPFVAPGAESATDGSYPLTRALYLYINKKPEEALSPAVLEFLKFTNSHEGQELVQKAGVYALPASEVQRNQAQLMDGRIAASSLGR